MPKICGITTQACTVAAFMLRPFNYATKNGFECYCISQPDKEGRINEANIGNVRYIPVDIKWGYMNPFELISTIYQLYKIFKREKFDIIQYATMNAALCASVAGWLARVPIRIDLLWGIDYVMFSGWKRLLYEYATRLICRLSTHVQPDSNGNLKFGVQNKLFPKEKGSIVYNGSACGLDLIRFNFSKRSLWREQIQNTYQLKKYKKVFGFIGSLSFDKGMNELLQAFLNINNPEYVLVLVGDSKKSHTINQSILAKAKQQDNIIFVGSVNNPECYYAGFDFLVLPSYAEGFGMVVLEAAGVGTPSIVSNITGPTDVVIDGFNGLICEARSVSSLQVSMEKAIALSKSDYEKMANQAYMIAKNNYDSSIFYKKFVENRLTLYSKMKESH